METYILLSELNDFIFCPRSIYWHHIYGEYDTSLYHTTDQVEGNIAHRAVDTRRYSSRKTILQWLPVYSHQYGILGKIDLFDTKSGILTERKRMIRKVYDGYLWQLYGQYFCLSEMGYVVTWLRLYSMLDNTSYPIGLPNAEDERRFWHLIERFRKYELDREFTPLKAKCERCIYAWLCDRSLVSESDDPSKIPLPPFKKGTSSTFPVLHSR